MLQTNKPIPGQTLDPFLNEIPVDENDISSRRVVDVVLTPLISRARREIQLEQRETLNKKFRQRRQTNQFRGKFRGQTQSQYLNIGSGEQKEGKAEAESTQQSSRAVVSKFLFFTFKKNYYTIIQELLLYYKLYEFF